MFAELVILGILGVRCVFKKVGTQVEKLGYFGCVDFGGSMARVHGPGVWLWVFNPDLFNVIKGCCVLVLKFEVGAV